MNRFSKALLFGTVLAAGCSRDATPPPAKPTAGVPSPGTGQAAPTPPVAVTPKPVATVDQQKLRAELEALGVSVHRGVEVSVFAAALTADGDFKPGIAPKLSQLESASSVQALDLPAFSVGAARAVAAIPGLTRVNLYRTSAPEAAIAALGDCPTLEQLDLNNGSGEDPVVTDACLAGFAKLKFLKSLRCEKGKITSAGLAALGGLVKLEELDFTRCPLDDSAAPHLAKLVNLTSLDVSYTKLTGKGLAVVAAGATKLTSLDMAGTALTDADVPALAALPGLTELWVSGTGVTDAGTAALAKSKSLAALSLSETKVTDAGVASLAGLPKLRSLTLYGLPLTDASLIALAKAPGLVELELGGNKFTADGLAKFAAARPKVTVRNR